MAAATGRKNMHTSVPHPVYGAKDKQKDRIMFTVMIINL